MTSFGSTILRVEGNTDSTGSATGNLTLSERRALSVKNYIVKNSRTFRRRVSKPSAAARPTR